MDDNTDVQVLNYALAGREDGKWAALFTAANEEDAQIGGSQFMSEWMDTQQEAEEKMREICDVFARMGLKIQPLKQPA